MRFNNILKLIALAGIVALLAVTFSTPASAQKTVRWKMASAWGSKLIHLGTSGARFSKNLSEASGGKFQMKFFEPGALIPALECFDTVSKGSIEACWTTPGYHTSKYKAVSFFTAVPFGPGFGEYMAWKMFGGGDKLRNDLYAKHNLIAFNNFAIGPETSGWFRKEITIGDLRGMKMRFFGLGAAVMQKMGVSTQLLAAADIYPALERGVIDATEFSMPTIDLMLGFYQIAKYNYFPGWHQQTSVSELLMNKAKYDKLSKQNKMLLQLAMGESVLHTYAESEAKNFGAMIEMRDKYNVKVRRWPDSTLAKFEKAWVEVNEEEGKDDPVWRNIAASYFKFREGYKFWKDAQTLKGTYLK